MRLLRRLRGLAKRTADLACREAASLVFFAGAAATAVGVGMIRVPAGVITGGVLLIVSGVLLARGEVGGDGSDE